MPKKKEVKKAETKKKGIVCPHCHVLQPAGTKVCTSCHVAIESK